jgi:uncharacterized protein YfaS (alpha-2-macroglobulin family)
MKIKSLIICLFFIVGIVAMAMVVKTTIKSASEKAIVEAIKKQDTPQMIKLLIARMNDQMEKDADTFPELINEIFSYSKQCKDSAGVAILHSMAAEMYSSYYQQHRYDIDQRTDLQDYVPEDIREWTQNLFKEKIKSELIASLKPASLLQHTSVGKYELFMNKGADMVELRPTLYDFLVHRAIDIQPDASWYEALLNFRRNDSNRKALLMAELDYLSFLHSNKYADRPVYKASLDSLYAIYGKDSFGAEIKIAELALLQSDNSYNRSDKASRDSMQAVIYKFCKESISLYPKYNRISVIKNALSEMEQSSLEASVANQNVYPGKSLKIALKYNNVNHVAVRIYKSLRTPTMLWRNYDRTPKHYGELAKELSFNLKLKNSYMQEDTTLIVPMDKLGLYEFVVASDDANVSVNGIFSVSRLAALKRYSEGKWNILVTDYESGKPVSDATVLYYRNNSNNGSPEKAGEVRSDHFGLAFLPEKTKADCVRPVLKDDTAAMATPIYYYSNYTNVQNEDRVSLSLFTDRNIYRPNQTVYFKGIAHVRSVDNPRVVPNHTFNVTFRDANRKEVAKKTLKTNKFGSFNGEFTIPQNALNGEFTILSENASTTIRVEEYKRPSFKVDITPLKDELTFGKAVVITGNAQTFSAVPLQSGTVSWRINKRPFRFYYNYEFPQDVQVANGVTKVDNKGYFSLTFVPEKDSDYASLLKMYGNGNQGYELTVSVTDSKGETQETTYPFNVGDAGIMLVLKPKANEMERDSASVEVSAYTINSEKIKTEGIYNVYSLSDLPIKSDLYNVETYQVGDKKLSGRFTTEKPMGANVFRSLPSGRYRLEVKASDKNGKEVISHCDFILYSKNDKRPPVFTHARVLDIHTQCLPGENAEFIFGTSDENVYVLYEIFSSTGKCVLRMTTFLSVENRTFTIPFKESDGNGFTVSLTFVKDGKMYNKEVEVTRRLPDKKLTIRTETFRDHLLPGNKESWKFHLTDADGKAVSAELLASMYDASLDRLSYFQWAFNPTQSIYLYSPVFEEGSSFGSTSDNDAGKIKILPITNYTYSEINWLNVLWGGNRFRSQRMYASKVLMAAPEMAEMADTKAVAMSDNATVLKSSNNESNPDAVFNSIEQSLPEQKLRVNFAETAFFYPVLTTDEQGNAAFSFTVPESNTTWKLQLLAQTEDLKYGYLSKEVITSKSLMVVPNLPRFFREGDEVSVSTQIINQLKETITGKARLELFDPANNQLIVGLIQEPKSFVLKGDSITTAIWQFKVPAINNGLVGCRIIAESNQGSDGEQHLVPVLSNQIMITESKPFFLFDTDQTQISLEKEGNPYRITLEMTANPIWYAVQALPTVSQPDNDNVISWFNAYYTNTLASYIAAANPRIQQIISQWKAKGGTASTLYSNLQKNEELKTILLQETPWVLEAENETEQKQRLELLFDMNRATQMRDAAMQQLLQQQASDGGWAWFKGMFASREITCYILGGMSQLEKLGAVKFTEDEKRMQKRALEFLDKRIQEDFKDLKKYDSSWQKAVLSGDQLNYLFVRSSYRSIPEPASAHEAIRFYTESARRNWDKFSYYGRAEIALLMHRNGNQRTVNDIMAWLRKTATVSSEKGMYWANNRREGYSFVSPISTHCLLMEAFHEISPVLSETNQLKQWLLIQKRTQNWETAPSTVNAIYALLLTGSDWLKVNNECVAQWGDKTFSSNDGEVGTGYLKVTVQGESIPSTGNVISIRKNQSTPVWGAVYEQYFTNLNQVNKNKGVLNVEKKLFIETNNGSERQLQALSSAQPLKVGDKIVVRLTVRTDREMDYVFLKDLHAGFFEANNQVSRTVYRDKVWYYESPTDVSENFFFDRLPQGTYVLEYSGYVSRSGQFTSGISTIQCLYAPEYVSHTEGGTLIVK